MVELVDLDLDLYEEPMEENDMDDSPTLIDKLPEAREHAQLLSNFVVEHFLEFSVANEHPTLYEIN